MMAAGGVWLHATARPAIAQDAVTLSEVEILVAATVNAVWQDANAVPDCVQLALPCTHTRASSFGGFGVNVAVARNLNSHAAVVFDVSTFAARWDDGPSAQDARGVWLRELSVAGGPRLSTGFVRVGREPGRFFTHALVGAEASDVTRLRPVLLVGGGVDGMIGTGRSRGLAPGPTRDFALRLELGYRFAPGTGRNLSGLRFVIGCVLGPRLAGP